MEGGNQSSKYIILSKVDIDKAVDRIIAECNIVYSHETIKKIISEAFYNRFILIQNCKEWDSINVYRITKEYEGFDPLSLKSFSYPLNPQRGRANLAGSPVFYCSVNPKTALLEMKEVLTLGEIYYVSEWCVKFSEDILIHPLIYNSKTLGDDFEMGSIVKDQMEKVFSGNFFDSLTAEEKDNIKYLFLKVGDLFTLPGSDYYHITSSYAHHILYDTKMQNADISILMYPSVTSSHKGINLAIHPNFVKSKMMSFNNVSKVKVLNITDEGVNVSVIEAGIINQEKKIDWYHPVTTAFEVAYDDFELYTDNGLLLRGNIALNLVINDSSISVKDLFHEFFEINIGNLPTPDLGVGFSLFPIKRKQSSFTYTQTFNKGNVILTANGSSNIDKIKVNIRYIETLKKKEDY